MASMASITLFMQFISFVGGRAETKLAKQIALGSSISPTTHTTSWPSPSGQFAFGFYQQGNGFAIGIWLVGNGINNNIVVWTVNRDDPPLPPTAKLELTNDGKLLVQTNQGQEELIANATTASSASMLDSGNFVLYSKSSSIIWQSFNYPSDTILGGQFLPCEGQLLSSSSETNYSSGRFHLRMQGDGNLVLYPVNTGDAPRDAYWDSITFGHGSKYHLYLNKTGALLIRNSSNLGIIRVLNAESSWSNSNNKNVTIYRATLDSDGVFRLYAHVDDGSGKLERVITVWSALEDPCRVKSFCGFNSYCTFNYKQPPYCTCLPGFDFVDPNHKTLGCKRNLFEAGCVDGKENLGLYNMTMMDNRSSVDPPYVRVKMVMEECSLFCLEDCDCGAALYEDNYCKKLKLPLKYVQSSDSYTVLLKVKTRVVHRKNNTVPGKQPIIMITGRKQIVEIISVVLCFALLLCSAIAISSHLIIKIRVLRYKRVLEIEELGLNEDVALRIFSYNELKRATNNFKQELGKGSFGAVYKGDLHKGTRLIAVKRLEKLVEEGEKEFQAEMQTIGKTHHRNLVRLLGYCAEDSKRLLVYEYMSNASLGKLLFGGVRRPDWDEKVRIAVDIARGILYLHEECEAPIIHCDIKPANILMDELWTAKISDFGLSKLLMPDQTRTFTGVRGTRGYVAPEWQKNIPISVKADVYSYGIVLLEIVCCRRNLDVHVPEPEEIVLSNWAYKCFVARELNKLVPGEEVDKYVFENMIKVGLWCIQDEPALRPTMKSVMMMLQGTIDVSVPPCPTNIFMSTSIPIYEENH